MSGWQIVHKVNETETVYKFHRSLKLAPGASVSVWSAGKWRRCRHTYPSITTQQGAN